MKTPAGTLTKRKTQPILLWNNEKGIGMPEGISHYLHAFEKKMQFYGMSVMKVGQLTDYLNPLGETFIKGQLLRLLSDDDNLEADNHLATELSAEISKGLYIGEYIPQGS